MARKVGSTNRPAFYTYTTEIERKAYAKWVKENYKKDTKLAVWYGDQMFGKAAQPIGGDPDNPLTLIFDSSFKDAATSRTAKNSAKPSEV